MTSEPKLEDIYNDINHLLKDVCSFLKIELQNGTLSAAAQNEAQKLVARSTKQVEVISTIAIINDNSNYPYLQMTGPNENEVLSEYVDADGTNHYECDEYEENYDQIDSNRIETLNTSTPIVAADDDCCPYSCLPANQLSEKAVKFGILYRKERYFILEQKKQLLAGLVDYWLLIYSGGIKCTKPSEFVNLTDYKAQALEQKKDPMFEIYSDKKKSFEFIARSSKDMDQWIVAINCKKQRGVYSPIRNLPEIPVKKKEKSLESWSDISNGTNKHLVSSVDDFESDSEIYENLDELNTKKPESGHQSSESSKSPKLPPRQPVFRNSTSENVNSNTNYNNIFVLPTSTKNITDEEEEENTYDPVQNTDIEEEEEEEIYDELKVSSPIGNYPSQIPQDSYDNEDLNYDIPKTDKCESQNNAMASFDKVSLSKNSNDYEDEDGAYDDLKVFPETAVQNTVIKVNQKADKKSPMTPTKTSPKPKIHLKLDRLTNFKKQIEAGMQTTDSQQEHVQVKESSNRIHNIIQQMEQTLSFKGSKN